MFITIMDGRALTGGETEETEETKSKKTVSTVLNTVVGVLLVFALVLAILIVVILEYHRIKLAVAFIPIFIIAGILFLCLCCTAPCIICCSAPPLEEGAEAESDDQQGIFRRNQKLLDAPPGV